MRVSKSIVAIAVLVCSAYSAAESKSSATVSNVTIQLIDLDLSDGVAPAINFNTGRTYNAFAGTSLYQFPANAPYWSSDTRELANTKFGPVITSDGGTLVSAKASVLGNGTLGGAVLHAAGRATSTPEVEGRYYAGAVILRDTSNAFSAEAFSLSPHTRAVFSADVDLFAQLVNEPAGATPHRAATAYAAVLVFEPGIGPSPGPQYSKDEWMVTDASSSADFGVGKRLQETITVQFENLNADWLTGALGVSADVNGESRFALAVPEPASLVSLTFGLALMGWRCRARRTGLQ